MLREIPSEILGEIPGNPKKSSRTVSRKPGEILGEILRNP
jgi:hypothetical protein